MTDKHKPGVKLDQDKPDVSLVLGSFARALMEVCKVGTEGAKKYSKNGWLYVPDGKNRYNSACERHYLKEQMGEEIDSDFGLLHAAHRAWNALAYLELVLREKEKLKTNFKPIPPETIKKFKEDNEGSIKKFLDNCGLEAVSEPSLQEIEDPLVLKYLSGSEAITDSGKKVKVEEEIPIKPSGKLFEQTPFEYGLNTWKARLDYYRKQVEDQTILAKADAEYYENMAKSFCNYLNIE